MRVFFAPDLCNSRERCPIDGSGGDFPHKWFRNFDISFLFFFFHFASMADRKHTREVFTILFLCVLWYVVSSSNNVIGKMLLSDFPYPITMTMVQLLSVTVFSGPLFNMWGVRKYVDISWRYYFKLIVPLAFGKFFASVFSHVSIWKVPVSYAHTGMYLFIF